MPSSTVLSAALSVGLAGVNVNVSDLTVDGLTLKNLRCSLDSGGLFASALVVGALAKEKKALDACVPAGAAVELEWTWSGSTASKAEAKRASVGKKAACVAAVVMAVPAPANGTCRATVLVGEPAAAAAAVEQMTPVPK
jgi:hypothetical protein